MKKSIKEYLNQPFDLKREGTRGKLSLGITVGIGSFILPLSAYNYFEAFYFRFGIYDFLTSDVIRGLHRLASGGLFLGAVFFILFLIVSMPIISFNFYDFIFRNKTPSNKFMFGMAFIFGACLGLAWIYFVKNEFLLLSSKDWSTFVLIELIIIFSLFVKRECIYILFFFLPFAFSQRGQNDAVLIEKHPIKFVLEYREGEILKEIFFDGKTNLFIDQSETFLYYLETDSRKTKRIKVGDIVSTKRSD